MKTIATKLFVALLLTGSIGHSQTIESVKDLEFDCSGSAQITSITKAFYRS